jgi:hypothetical protein
LASADRAALAAGVATGVLLLDFLPIFGLSLGVCQICQTTSLTQNHRLKLHVNNAIKPPNKTNPTKEQKNQPPKQAPKPRKTHPQDPHHAHNKHQDRTLPARQTEDEKRFTDLSVDKLRPFSAHVRTLFESVEMWMELSVGCILNHLCLAVSVENFCTYLESR